MTTRLQTSLTIAAALAAVTLSSLAQTLEILLPGPAPDAATANLGRDVILNPFTSSPGPGVFIATEKASWSDTSGYSIFRLAPTDASSTQFNMEPVDGSLTGASRMAYNPGDGLYAAGFAVTVSGSKGKTSSLQTWKVCRSSETGRGDSGTWGEDDSFNRIRHGNRI